MTFQSHIDWPNSLDRGAAALRTGDTNRTAMKLNDSFYDRQTKADRHERGRADYPPIAICDCILPGMNQERPRIRRHFDSS